MEIPEENAGPFQPEKQTFIDATSIYVQNPETKKKDTHPIA